MSSAKRHTKIEGGSSQRYAKSEVSPIKRRVRMAVALLAWIIIWQLIALAVHNELVFASPWQTLSAFFAMAQTWPFWRSALTTVFTISSGFLIACVLGIICGVIASHEERFRIFIQPFSEACKSIPVACIIVVLMLWFGSGGVVIAVVFLISFPAYYEAMLKAQTSQNSMSKNVLARMGVPKKNIWLAFIWPRSLHFIESTSRSAVGTAWKAGISAQVIGLLGGTLGDEVYNAKLLLETGRLFALTIVIVFLAWVCEQLFLLLLHYSQEACIKLSLKRTPPSPQKPEALAVQDVSFAYEGKPLIRDFSLTIEPAHSVLLQGATGSGKTTLLSIILGSLMPSTGTVSAPRYISYSPQVLSLPHTLSVEQIMRLVVPETSFTTACKLIKKHIGSEGLARSCVRLSGGQARMVQLILALFAPTQAMLLDEPFQGMDESMKKAAHALLLKYAHKRPVLITAHEAVVAREVGASVVALPCLT